MTDVSMTPMTEEHLAAVAELERLSFSEPWSENALRLYLTDAAAGVVLLDETGTVQAYGGMMLAPDEGQITNIAVHPSARRRGYGKKVLEALLHFAKKNALLEVSLEVRASNTAAISLYLTHGFEKAGVRRHFYRNPPEDGAVMIKKID